MKRRQTTGAGSMKLTGWTVNAVGLVVIVGAGLAASPGLAQTAYTTWYSYNVGGEQTGVVQPLSGSGFPATRNNYNAAGLLVEVDEGSLSSVPPQGTDPSNWSGFSVTEIDRYGYDSMGRVVWKEAASPAGAIYALTEYSYDSMSREQCVAIRMNPAQGPTGSPCSLATQGNGTPDRITYTTYDPQGHPLKVVRGYGTPDPQSYATYTYTPNGLVRTVQDANENLTTLDYDGYDRLSETQFPSTSGGGSSASDVEQYAYDNDDNRSTLVTRDGQTIQYSYDALNRLVLKEWRDATGTNVYYGYDLQNHRLYANFGSSGGEGVTDAYDGFGNLTSETVDLGGVPRGMSYEYDADGNRTRVTYPDQAYIDYSYDGGDRLSQVLEEGGYGLAVYSYDGEGRISQITRGSGVPATGYGYDALSRLSSLSLTLVSGTVSYSFGYNPADQITSESLSNSQYDPLAGASQSYSANGLNEYSLVGSANYSYDGRGNLTSDGSTTYSYDIENHLTSTSGARNATLTYDPLGRLYEVSSSSSTTTFVYDGDRIAAEYDASGNLANRYVYSVSGDDPIVWYEGSAVGASSRRYLLADHEGSIAAVTDSSGNDLAVNQYDPYGEPGSNPNLGRFQFTGQAFIPEVALYYYKARMYSPSLGRFLQTDPIGYKDDLDLYAYVHDDPIDGTDPTGEIVGVDDAAEGTAALVALAAYGVCYYLCPSAAQGIKNAAEGIYDKLHDDSAPKPNSGPKPGTQGGDRAGKPFTPKGKAIIDAENAAKNGGVNKCENCGTEVVPGKRSEPGVSPPGNQRERDHIIPESKGGNGDPSNGQILCRDCNGPNGKSDQDPVPPHLPEPPSQATPNPTGAN